MKSVYYLHGVNTESTIDNPHCPVNDTYLASLQTAMELIEL